MIDAYPLQWPPMWPRTDRPQRSRFDTTLGEARSGVLRELGLLGARDVVISCNVPTRRDGLPYAARRDPDAPGVAVYFTLRGEQRCIPCDKWDTVKDNLRAIQHTVAALRGLERWGAKAMVDAAFAGFAALPAGGTSAQAWWEVLELTPDATWDEIGAAYRRLSRVHHPDAGGRNEAFYRITEAYEQAKEWVR
jgi:DnaJ-domain-containing protein 1